MNKQRLLLIINPISGTSKKDGLDELVTQRISESLGMAVDVRITGAKGDATRFAKEAVEHGYFGVIAVGGDGTVNETAAALCGSDVALGIIPAGSGNGLARHLEIPIDINLSLDVITENNVVACDYATVNDRPFFCTFGIGFDAEVSDRFAQQKKRGKFMYFKSALEVYRKYHYQEYKICINGEEHTLNAFLIACCNASQYGNNAYIAPAASMSDGKLDVVIIHKGSPIRTIMVGLDLFTGYINKSTLVQTIQAKDVVIYRKEEGPAHLDGEPCIFEKVLDVKCHPQKLKIFVPTARKECVKPFLTPLDNALKGLKISMSKLLPKRNFKHKKK